MPAKKKSRNRWPTTVTISLEDHIAHFKALNEEALQGEDENGFYHSCDWALNFNALRTSSKNIRLSVYPQAQLKHVTEREVSAIEPSDRVTRSAAAAGQDLFDLSLPSIDNISAISSAVISANVLPKEKSTNRFPDFIVAMKSKQLGDRALLVVEVKPLSYLWYQQRSDKERAEVVADLVNRVSPQMLEQAQYTFVQYPEQRIVVSLCIVETYFRVAKFLRSKTPAIGEYWPTNELQLRWTSSLDQLLNEKGDDYSRSFKTWWTKAIHLQGVKD